MLKAIGMWILKALLGGLFRAIQEKETARVKDERDRAKIAFTTSEEAKDVEMGILTDRIELEKTFKAREVSDDDVLGFKSFNRGD